MEVSVKKERNSNLELLRIVLMFLIVAHHSVVNSGILEFINFGDFPIKTLFIQFWGMWGKTAINAFVLITGYFMCKSNLTFKKFLKLFLEVKFYNVIILVVFLFFGYPGGGTLKSIYKALFYGLVGVNKGFTASFLFFYLFIPFMNKLIQNLNKKEHKYLIGLLLVMYTITSTFFFNGSVFSYIGWYMTLYFVASYIRLYPNKITESFKICLNVLLISVLLSLASIVCIDVLGNILNKQGPYYYFFLADSNKILAFIVGLFTFLTFKNMNIKQSKIINKISSTTFGILLIHANSDAMRQWLWKDIFGVNQLFDSSLFIVIFKLFIICLIIFIVCSILDYLRIIFIEKPFFKWFDSFMIKRKVES